GQDLCPIAGAAGNFEHIRAQKRLLDKVAQLLQLGLALRLGVDPLVFWRPPRVVADHRLFAAGHELEISTSAICRQRLDRAAFASYQAAPNPQMIWTTKKASTVSGKDPNRTNRTSILVGDIRCRQISRVTPPQNRIKVMPQSRSAVPASRIARARMPST